MQGDRRKKVQAELSKHTKKSQRQSFLDKGLGKEIYQGSEATSPNTPLALCYRNVAVSALH